MHLHFTFHAAQTPYQAPQDCIDRFKHIAKPTRRIYAGMDACLDDEIGEVVDSLEKMGLRNNTLIVFYRDGKGSLFEGGCRVAACTNWPG